MVDMVIPLGNRSTVNNLELKYCLRSIEKYLKGVGKVFIIGECPDWLQRVIHIPKDDTPGIRFKERNIAEKISLACNDKRVSNDFLMVHDDHFLLQPFTAKSFPYVHHGMITVGEGFYRKTKENTMRLFGQQIRDYDSHCPILFNKEKFLRAYNATDWTKWYGYLLKTVYCIYNEIQAEYYPDLKIRWMETKEEMLDAIDGRRWFSIGDRCWGNGYMKQVLEELYPNKSKYER
jgi:hypothetical protein